MSKCIIMCAGEFEPLQIEKEEDDFVIAADNGLSYLLEMGILPDIVIGDYDSLSPEGQRTLRELEETQPERVVHLPVEKDDTDTMAAVREGLARGYDAFYLYAALGGRLDHTLANIQTLAFIRSKGAKGYILSADSMLFVLSNETREFSKGFRGGFSLFSLGDRCRGVTIRGMKYELEDAEITNTFPIGVSNYIPGDQKASVTIREGMALAYVSWG